jgi:hypothetical protein
LLPPYRCTFRSSRSCYRCSRCWWCIEHMSLRRPSTSAWCRYKPGRRGHSDSYWKDRHKSFPRKAPVRLGMCKFRWCSSFRRYMRGHRYRSCWGRSSCLRSSCRTMKWCYRRLCRRHCSCTWQLYGLLRCYSLRANNKPAPKY